MRITPHLFAVGLLLAGCAAPVVAQQPGPGCRFLEGSGNFSQRSNADGVIISVQHPIIACDDGRNIRADSINYYQAAGYAEFWGNVRFSDADRTLEADSATYIEITNELQARGSVSITDRRDNSSITDGENLIYFRAVGGRVADELTVFGGRPRATLQPAAGDSIEGPDEPWDVIADRIFLRGESWFEAQGDVQMTRDSIVTRSDSLDYNEVTGTLNLTGRARMEQGETVMTGRRIRARIPQNAIEELVAFGEGELRADELDLTAPWIRVTFRAGELQALYAAPLTRQEDSEVAEEGQLPPAASRPLTTEERMIAEQEVGPDPLQATRDSLDAMQPVALAEGTTIRADSLDVSAPGQQIDKVIAVGRAYAVSASRDSINTSRTPDFAREDWIRGDTIVATFIRGEPELVASVESGPARAGKLEIEQLVATGTASSMYRIPPDSTSTDSTVAPDGSVASPPADSIPSIEVPPVIPLDATGLMVPADSVVFTPLPGREPAIHYVAARQITLNFVAGEIDTMVVLDLEEGVHLEPAKAGSGNDLSGTPAPGSLSPAPPVKAGGLR